MSCLTYRSLFICSLISFCGLFADGQSASAQIVPDQTTATEVNGNAIAPVGAGTVSGGNLYHSFDQFNVPKSGVTFSTGNSTVDGGKIDNILNRVTGENPSQILGTIESRTAFPNANLYLMNPNGVVFGKDARLDIGGSFNVNTGTSLGFTGDRQFSADKAKLDFPSGDPQNIKFGISQPAAIINQGNLAVDAGKNITFTAGSVINSGVLTAPSGNVALTSVTGGSLVDLRSPDLVLGLSVAKNAVPTDWNGEISTLPKLAELLTGKAAEGDRVVIKPDGTLAIVATPAADQVPVITGTTVISGSIDTSSVNADGGKVGIFGDRVALVNSQITANSGNVLIGGDFQGKGVVPNAQYTYFDNKSVVDVSALQNGKGGKAIIWGDITTQFFGTILSKGGSLSGDGGFVEVSGKENLSYLGNVDTSATNGSFGTLLLDPTNITIDVPPSLFGNNDGQLAPNVPVGDPAFNISFGEGGAANFLISNTALNAATSNIILQATNDISVNVPVSVAAANISFTAQAGNNINVNQNITTNGGNISLLANNGVTATGTGSIQSTTGVNSFITTNGGNFTSTGFNFGNITAINTTSSTGGGNINIDVTGAINANSSTLLSGVASSGTGNAGNITLRAVGNIQASALQAADAVGANVINGGNVSLDAGGNITIGPLGSIATRSTSGGKAGDVVLKSGGSITALGTTGINASVIGSSVGGSQAGNVTFQAGTTINTDAVIATSINSNTVTGNAGSITLNAGDNISATGDLIAANLGTGNAGQIAVMSSSDSITTGNIVAGSLATASNVTLNASNNITTGYILGIGGNQGSNVSLTATNGNITIPSTAVIPNTLFGVNLAPCSGSAICTTSLSGFSGNIGFTAGGTINATGQFRTVSLGFGKSGNINFTSAGNLTTGFLITGGLLATGTGGTGDVELISTSGNITTTDIIVGVSAVNSTGDAGNVTISAFGDVNLISADTSITETTATGNAGKITITSQNGLIAASGDLSSGVLRGSGNGNDLIVSAKGNVSAVNVGAGTVFDTGKGGNIKINGDSISLTTVGSAALLGDSGNVELNAANNITVGLILNLGNTKGGDVSITSTSGTIQIPSTIPTSVPQAPGANIDPCVGSSVCTAVSGGLGITGGNITINGSIANTTTGITFIANQDIFTGSISTLGNPITLTSIAGSINTSAGTLDSSRLSANGNSGAISLASVGTDGTVTTGDIRTNAVNGSGGNVSIQADKDINVSSISTNNLILLQGTNSSDLNGGDVSLTSTIGNITVGTINTSTSGEFTTLSSEIIGLVPLSGRAGNINLQAVGDVNTSELNGDGGSGFYTFPKIVPVTIQQGNPPVDVIVNETQIFGQSYYFGFRGDISLASTSGKVNSGVIVGENVSIQSFDSLKVSNISGFSNVLLTSTQGSITSDNANSFIEGSILTVQADDSINLQNIFNTFELSLTSTNGSVTVGDISASFLTIQAPDSISTSSISGFGFGGNISLTSTNGNVTTGYLDGSVNFSSANQLNGGNVTIQARGDIKNTGNVTLNGIDYAIATFSNSGNGGNISLISDIGAIDVSLGRVNSAATSGTSGSITFQSAGDITTGAGTTPNPAVASFVSAGGTGTPNSIFFTSTNGAINTSLGDVDAGGGNITFTALNNITTSGVFSRALNGGSVKLESQSGAINTTAGDLTTTTTSTGTGGNITLLADNNITTRGVFATGDNGKISITSTNGGIDTTQGSSSLASIGSNNDITLTARQNIVTRDIFATGDQTSLSITSTNGAVDTSLGTIQGGIAAPQNGNGGNITISAAGNILAGAINAPNINFASGNGNAGSIFLTSNTGSITFTGIDASRVTATAGSGNGGEINLQASGNITSTGVVLFGVSPSIYSLISGVFGGFTGNGGAISLTSTNGSIDTRSGTVSTSSPNGTGGNITFTSNTGAIATENLLTDGTTQGGDIFINALTQIDVGQVNSSSSLGSGGNVTLDPIGNVTFTTIDATGNTTQGANGGNVNIVSTGGNVLGTGQLLDSISICDGATICTNGTGTVSIQHGITSPFNLNTFLVNSTGILNGTVGTIVTGSGSLLSFTGIPNGAGFFTQGNISITPGQGIFIPPVDPPVTPPVVPPVTPPSPSAEPNENQTVTPINPIIVASISPIIVGSTDFPFLDVSKISNAKAGEYLALGNFEEAFNEIEKGHLSAYENYLGETLTPQVKNIEQLQQELEEVSQLSGSVTTVVYPIILDDRLELMIIPPKGMGKPFREFVTQAKESEIVPVILDFANNVRDSSSQDYLEQSQQLYNWLVRPYSDRLQTLQDRYQPTNTQANPKQLSEAEKQPKEKLPPTLVFVMDGGLRVIPVAALHDGKQFLIEKYALANLPYLRVSRLENRDRNLNSILAMGLTESMQGFSALPSVKIEVSTISSQALKSSSYLDQEFTISNLQDKRRQGDFAVLHLATHAQFISNDAKGSFIQFWNERLFIDRVPSLRFDSPLVEMLTLSACQTAVGQNLGLGGLAISSGAKSVLASLWEVSDSGTAPLMIQFYNSFPENITKAIALQRAQIDMLSGKVRIEDGNILGIPKLPAIPLSTLNSDEINLRHPFFWSSFILIGNWL